MLVVSTLIISISSIYSIPAYPYPIKVTQPDGSVITIRMKGDEFFKYKTTIDGYLLTTNAQGVLTYAELNEAGLPVSTMVKASDIENRTSLEKETIKRLIPNQSMVKANTARRKARSAGVQNSSRNKTNFPINGSPSSLVILVNFAGATEKFVTPTPQLAFSKLLNQSGYAENGGTGSARDYFMNNSSNVFSPSFDVVGPYTLPNNMTYYGENDANGDDKKPQQMVIDACTLAFNNGIDFSKYDTDNDGFVDNIFIYYAGHNEAENASANTVWPHRWSLADYSTKFNGKTVYDYACTSELKNATGSTMCGIGTFCHEFGHVLGLPDYYATNDAKHQTLSYWSIMDSGPYLNGGKTPPAYSAYDRFYLNWLTPTELINPSNITLEPLTTSNKAYIITQYGNHNLNGRYPSPTEFFTLENRQKIGWDTYLPGHGMLVTRINYNSSTWNDNTPNNVAELMGVDIMEADNIASDASLSGDPFPGTSNVSSYSAILRSGTDIFKKLTNITENVNGNIQFSFVLTNTEPLITTQATITNLKTVQGVPSDSIIITVNGTKLKADILLSFAQNKHFEMKKQSQPNSLWAKTLSITSTNETVLNEKIMIRYNPTVPSFAATHSENLLLNSTGATQLSLILAGKSSRKVYIVSPVASEATEKTTGSFVANWSIVPDSTNKVASGYYLTAYNISSGESELSEGFDNGLNASNGWTISASAVSISSQYCGKSTPAIILKNTDEGLITEDYILPVKNLSCFIKSVSGNNGALLLEGFNGTDWDIIDVVSVVTNLNTTKNYTFTINKNFTKFRLTYTKGVGDLVIDDINVKFFQNIQFIVREKWIASNSDILLTTNSDTLMNLLPNHTYYYKVRASDKTLNSNSTIKYENVTNFSNIIEVKTLENKVGNIVRIRVDDGTLIAMLPTTDLVVRIYNTMGQLVKEVIPNTNIFEIKDLPRGQIFILEAGNNRAKFMIP